MAKEADRNLIVALDIGTSKVASVVGEITEDDQLHVVANMGRHFAAGMSRDGWNRSRQGLLGRHP